MLELGLGNGSSCFVYSAGKTLLAKAVANQTSATFLRVCGSELIQKYLVRICDEEYL